MQRFVLQSNIERFERLLASEASPDGRRIVAVLLGKARRELALLDAASFGSQHMHVSQSSALQFKPPSVEEARKSFKRMFEQTSKAYLIIDPGPGLHIVDLTDSYASATMIAPSAIVGLPLFEAFPDNPADPAADGVTNLYTSIKMVVQSRRPHTMSVQRYDIRDASGSFVERYWRPVNTPLFGDHGEIKFILHQAEDVTAAHKAAS
jgi:hypothetical protein